MAAKTDTKNQRKDTRSYQAADTKTTKKSRKGFAAMTKERRDAIARLGGKRAHQLGKAHEWTREEAVAAGRLGGKRRHMRAA